MLELLQLNGVGPAPEIEWHPAPRLNLITGDNGMGKTFLLEAAWWALTGTWAGYPPYPRQDTTKPAITFRFADEHQPHRSQQARYNWDRLEWTTPSKRSVFSGLSIFAHVDGSFTIWDSAKYTLSGENKPNANSFENARSSTSALHFSAAEVFDGISINEGEKIRVLCNGLINDWVYWQNANPTRFEAFCAVLQALSPHPTTELLIPGEPVRLPEDARMIPTLKFPYGEVPILICSSGIQRIAMLAYLLVWGWNEHVVTSKLMRKSPEPNIALLIDEVELHLHPLWQRAIVPALMDVTSILDKEAQTQMIFTTHSPLVLASLETSFAQERDNLLHLYLNNDEVQLEDIPFVKRGRVDLWLMSDIFGLQQPRSKIAEEAIEEAKQLQLTTEPRPEDVKRVSDKLMKVLAQDDEFWPRWTYFAEQRGVHL